MEYGIDYYPIQYVGVGVSIYAAGDFGGTSRSFIHNDFFYQTENVNNELSLRTSLQLQSPAIWRKSDGSLMLFVKEDCGLTLPIPANQNLEYTMMPGSPGTYLVSEKISCQKRRRKILLRSFQNFISAAIRSLAVLGRLHLEQFRRLQLCATAVHCRHTLITPGKKANARRPHRHRLPILNHRLILLISNI
ncbi:MAG: hypothetical protein ACI30R_08425 [Sodaliphilus sp.]